MAANANDIMTLRGAQVTCKILTVVQDQLGPWLETLDITAFETVKSSRVRTVWQGSIPAHSGGDSPTPVHFKTYRAVTISDRTRDTLGGARGVREFQNLLEARSRGLRCVEPLAAGKGIGAARGAGFAGDAGSRREVGSPLSDGASFLLTRTLSNAEPMATRGWSVAAASAAGSALRAAHDAGLHTRDLHPGNLLLQTTEDSTLVPWLCDLTSCTLANPLEREQRAHALAFFCRELDGLVQDPAAAPLLEAYGASTELIARAQQHAHRLRNRLLSAFGRRATRSCKHTETVEVTTPPPTTLWCLRRDASTNLLDAAKTWQADQSPKPPIKKGRRGSVYLDGDLAIKRRNPTSARALFRAAYWLEHIEVPTPKPVALALAAQTGTVFSARIKAPDLATAWDTLTHEELRRAAHDLGNSLGRLHAFGLRNRDLKLENLIRHPSSPHRVFFIDLDGVRRRRATETRGQGRDLGRLFAAVQERTSSSVLLTGLVRAFHRSYYRAFQCLRTTINPRLKQHSAARAREWVDTHRLPSDTETS